jgi:protein-L-isoaspartate(D-aspartate) O-methyltransferase
MAEDEAAERRAALIAHLERDGALSDPAVRAAMLAVPRHHFLPETPLALAYADDAIATKFADGVSVSSASQPAIVAQMLEQLALAPGMRVLEIGAGTGYNAAILRTLVGPSGHVTTIDIDEDITDAARAHLNSIGMTDVEVITGDGALGWPPNAPYDRVILTVNAGDIAPTWAAQLAEGGLLVLPLTIGTAQFSVAFEKHDDVLQSQSLVSCGFMPLRGSMAGGATGSISLSPAPGLTLTIVNAWREQADAVAALLQTPPTPTTFPLPARGWWNALAFALAGAEVQVFSAGMRSEDVRYGFTGYAFGVFDQAVTSGCVLSFESTRDADPRVNAHTYGSIRVTDWLTETLVAWETAGAPQPSAYHVTAFPQPSTTTPHRGFIVDLPHWRLLIEQER